MMLQLHLIGALISLLLVSGGVFGIIKQKTARGLMVALPIAAAWQVGTGVGLVFQGAGLLRMCLSGAAYLAVMLIVWYRLLRLNERAPITGVVTADE